MSDLSVHASKEDQTKEVSLDQTKSLLNVQYKRKIWRLVVSFVVLLGLNFLYIFVGKIIFIRIESGQTRQQADQETLRDTVTTIDEWKQANPARARDPKEHEKLVEKAMQDMEARTAANNRLTAGEAAEEKEDDWSDYGGYIYAYQILSTIGWGKIVPQKDEGKAITIIYSIFGLPLFFSVSNALGDGVNSILLRLYKLFRWIFFSILNCLSFKRLKPKKSIASSDVTISEERGRDITGNKAEDGRADFLEETGGPVQWEGFIGREGDDEVLAKVFAKYDFRTVAQVLAEFDFTEHELFTDLLDSSDLEPQHQSQQYQTLQQNTSQEYASHIHETSIARVSGNRQTICDTLYSNASEETFIDTTKSISFQIPAKNGSVSINNHKENPCTDNQSSCKTKSMSFLNNDDESRIEKRSKRNAAIQVPSCKETNQKSSLSDCSSLEIDFNFNNQLGYFDDDADLNYLFFYSNDDENKNAKSAEIMSQASSETTLSSIEEYEPLETLPIYAHFLLMLLYLTFGAAVLWFYSADGLIFGDAVYFIYITLSTLGFGDFSPETHMWAFFFIYTIIGLALFQVLINSLIGIIASFLEGLHRYSHLTA